MLKPMAGQNLMTKKGASISESEQALKNKNGSL